MARASQCEGMLPMPTAGCNGPDFTELLDPAGANSQVGGQREPSDVEREVAAREQPPLHVSLVTDGPAVDGATVVSNYLSFL